MLEQGGQFAGINRKVQLKPLRWSAPEEGSGEQPRCVEALLILKHGGVLTHAGRQQVLGGLRDGDLWLRGWELGRLGTSESLHCYLPLWFVSWCSWCSALLGIAPVHCVCPTCTSIASLSLYRPRRWATCSAM